MDEYDFRIASRNAMINEFGITDDLTIKNTIETILRTEDIDSPHRQSISCLIEQALNPDKFKPHTEAIQDKRKKRMLGDEELYELIDAVKKETGKLPSVAGRIGLPEDICGWANIAKRLRERDLTIGIFYKTYKPTPKIVTDASHLPDPKITPRIRNNIETLQKEILRAFENAATGKPVYLSANQVAKAAHLHIYTHQDLPTDDVLGIARETINTLFQTKAIYGLAKTPDKETETLDDLMLSKKLVAKDGRGALHPTTYALTQP